MVAPDLVHPPAYYAYIYSRITNETGRERTQQTKWPAPLLKRQQVLYGHILQLEKSIPLWMATFDENLNQPVTPGGSDNRGRPCSFWVTAYYRRWGYIHIIIQLLMYKSLECTCVHVGLMHTTANSLTC